MTDPAKKISQPATEPEPKNDDPSAGSPPEVEEKLDAEDQEYRALRRDLDGVKGASAAGIVAISVGKTPAKNEFFRVHPGFRPIVSIVNTDVGMEKQYFAVTADMVTALSGIGITVSDHGFTSPSPRRARSASCRCGKPTATASRTSTTAPRRSA
jgi:hypothetical protein